MPILPFRSRRKYFIEENDFLNLLGMHPLDKTLENHWKSLGLNLVHLGLCGLCTKANI